MSQVTGDSSIAGVPAVSGTSVVARGVQGNSTKDHGVVGHSTNGTGVFGESDNQRGVEGHSTKDHGVVGHSTDGAGVVGVSEKGIGISGRGAKLAGHFEGKVDITESLTVQGIDVVGLLRHLQQLEPLFQRLLRLEPILAELEAEFAARSVISVQQDTPAHDGVARFHFTGKNFRPGATIKIQVKSNTSAGQLAFLTTDGQGTLGPIAFLELTCKRGTVLSILAIDEATSQVSSTVTITCT